MGESIWETFFLFKLTFFFFWPKQRERDGSRWNEILAPSHKISVLGGSLIETHNYSFMLYQNYQDEWPSLCPQRAHAPVGKAHTWKNYRTIWNWRSRSSVARCFPIGWSGRDCQEKEPLWGASDSTKEKVFRMSESSNVTGLCTNYNSCARCAILGQHWEVSTYFCPNG